MEIEFDTHKIKFDKVLNNLDTFAIDFCGLLNKIKLKYAIISGYEAVLFGRNRASEDIDIFLEKINKEKFRELWNALMKHSYWGVNAEFEEAFSLLTDHLAVRFARKGQAVPNMEVKFPNTDLDFYSLNNRVKVILNGNEIHIGPIELNIAFKLALGTPKDIEDARFLFATFKEKLNKESLLSFVHLLKVEGKAKEYLWQK